MAIVADGTINMVASFISTAAKKCMDAMSALDMAKRGSVISAPLYQGLFDQDATNRVFASLPTIIHILKSAPPRCVTAFLYMYIFSDVFLVCYARF